MTSILRRRRKALLLTVLPVGLIATVLSLSTPVRYRSTATLRAEGVVLPEATVEQPARLWADSWVRGRAAEVLAATALPQLPRGPEDDGAAPRVPGTFGKSRPWQEGLTWEVVHVGASAPQGGARALADVVFRVGFTGGAPEAAQRVVRDVSDALTRSAEPGAPEPEPDPRQVLEESLAAAQARVAQLEEQLLRFGQAHLGEMPEHTPGNLEMAAQLRRDLQSLDTQIQTLETKKTGLEERLEGLEPVVWVEADPPTPTVETLSSASGTDLRRELLGARPASPAAVPDRETAASVPASSGSAVGGAGGRRARLEELGSQLAALQRILGPSHPDVLALAAEVAALTERLQPVEARHAPPRRSLPNPEYQAVQTELSETVGQLKALEGGRTKAASQLRDHERKLARAPAVEREHRALVLEREEARRVVSDLGRRAEESRAADAARRPRAVRVSLIEPASLPSQPLAPSRALLLALAWIASLAAGGVVAGICNRLDDTVAGPEQVAAAGGIPVVATLPWVPEQGLPRAQRVRWTLWALGGAALAGLSLVTAGAWGPRLGALWGVLRAQWRLGGPL